MALESSSVTRALMVAVSLLLVGGLAGAVTTSDNAADQLEAGGSTTSSTAPTGTEGAGDGGDGHDSAPAAGGGAATGSDAGDGADGGGGSNAEAAPNPAATFTPPKDGTYRYSTESDGEKDENELTVRTTSRASGEIRQSIGGQFDANSGDLRVVWKDDGWTWEGISAEGGGQAGDCSFTPPLRYVQQPVAVGNTWSYDSSCKFTFGAESASLRISGTAKVSGVGTAKVDGESVDVWIIDRVGTYEVSFGVKKTSIPSKSTEQWAPAFGLNVRSTSTVKTEDGEQSQTRVLLSLQPGKPS